MVDRAGLFKNLRCVIVVCPDIILVCRSKPNGALRVKLESPASDHLQIQLFLLEELQMRKISSTDSTYLIVIVEFLKVTLSDEVPHDLII